MGKNTTPSNQTSDAVVTNYAASVEWVLAMLSDTQDQHLVLALAIERELTPPDPKNPPDGWPLSAWRLSQVLRQLLESTGDLCAATEMLKGESLQELTILVRN